MFRFTSKKKESEIFQELQQRHYSRPATSSRESQQLSIGNIAAKSGFTRHKDQGKTVSHSPSQAESTGTPVFDNFAFGKNPKPSTSQLPNDIALSSKQEQRKTNNTNEFGTYNFPKREKKQSYYIIPSSKAGLMDVFEKYKNYTPAEQTAFKKPPSALHKTTRHFRALSQHSQLSSSAIPDHIQLSFTEANPITVLNQQQNQQNRAFSLNSQELLNFIQQSQEQNVDSLNLTFNSSFITNEGNKYKQTHNSCFRGVSRDKLSQFPFGQSVPGPGKYDRLSQFEVKKEKLESPKKEKLTLKPSALNNIKQQKQSQPNETSQLSITRVKKKLTNIVPSDKTTAYDAVNEEKIQTERTGKVNPSFMFISDQRDRFGENQFINYFSNKNPIYCPGPGQYKQTHHTILDKQERIEKIKDQRKLLKEWLNPKQMQQAAQNEQVEKTRPELQYTPDELYIYQFSYS